MSKMLRTAGIVVAAVALVAMTAGTAAPAIAGSATAAASAGGVAGVSAATLTAVGAYGGLAASVLTAAAAATAPGVSSQGSATDFTTNPQSGLPYAMGRTRMSGLRFFAATNTRPGYTKFNDLLWFGALLSIGGQIEGIEKFTADGEVVTFDASGNAVGNFRDYMGQKVHLGGPMSTALNLSLGGGTAPGWTSAHKLSGITHAMWCLRYNKQGEMYGAGAPEPAWIGKWVKVYDPRLDSTYPGGSGSCRALVESTYVWSDNPGLHALTWALGRWQNGERTCGIGAPVETIRMAEFVECANVCEANGWKVGGVEWTTDSKWDTLKRILQAGGARPTQTAAMIGCLVNTPRTAIATIESRHLLDGLSLAATKTRRERISSVIPRYVDEDSDWSVISGTAITVSEYATADKGKRTKEIDFPLVQVFSGEEAKQPGQLAAYEIVNSREAGPWTFTTGPEWIGLKTGDVVYLNVPEEGLVNQPVMITRRAIDPSTGKVSFAVETETYAKHAFALGETTTPPAPWSPTAPDLKPPAPVETEWSVTGTTSGEGFPALLVAGDSEMPSADAIVIDYRLHSGNETATDGWTNSAILSAVDAVRHVIAPLESQTPYDVRVSYRVGTIDGDTTVFEQVVTGVGKITTIENHLEDQDEQLAQLDTDIAQAAINISAAQNTIAQMQVDAAATKAELEEDISSLNATAAQIQADAAGTRASLEAAQADILEAGGRVDTIEIALGDQDASINSIAQTVSNHTGRLASIDTTLSANGASINQNAQAISAVQGDLASLSSTVATQGASITQNAQAITTANQSIASLTTRVGTAESSISQNATAISGVSGRTATLESTVSAHGTSITQNAQAISTTQGNLASLSSTVSTQGSSITQLQTASSTQAGQIATLTTRVTAGNGNLLPNGGPENGTATWTGSAAVATIDTQVGISLRVNSTAGTTALYGPQIAVTAGQVYTASADTQYVGAGAGNGTAGGGYFRIMLSWRNSSDVEVSASYGPLRATHGFNNAVNRPANAVTGTAPTGVATVRVLAVGTNGGTVGTSPVYVDARQIKLELGSVWTPYTNEAGVTQSFTALSTLNTQYASLSTTVSTQGSSITANSTAIMTLQTNVATLTTQVSAGSSNLLVNGGLENGLSGMTTTGTWASYFDAKVGQIAALSSNPGSGQAALAWPDITVGAGVQLTASANASFAATGGYCYLVMEALDASGAHVGWSTQANMASAFDWSIDDTRRGLSAITYTTPTGTAKVRLRFVVQSPGTLTFAGVAAVKVQRGATWSRFSNEASVAQSFSALSTLNTQYASLSSTVSTQGVTITQQQTAITTINGNVTTLYGRAALTIEAGGVITGWEVNNNGTTGDIKLRADRVSVVTASGGTKTFEIRQGTIIGYYSNSQKMYQLGEQSVA